MQLIPFGEWLPDLGRLGAGTIDVENVLPIGGSFVPLHAPEPRSEALGAAVQGNVSIYSMSGQPVTIAGTATGLYKLVGDAWADVSGAAGPFALGGEDGWAFARYGDRLIATNGLDRPLKLDLGSGTGFVALGGDPPLARAIAVVRDFLVLGRVAASANRVQWSAFGNPEAWTVGDGQSDFQDLPEGGGVQAIVGGEFGIVFTERSIYSMTATGDDFVFQFDEIESGRGLMGPSALVKVGPNVFYLAHDGFYALAGGRSESIGHRKVDRFFLDDLNDRHVHRITAVADPVDKLVMWSYPSRASADGTPDRLIVYNWATGSWARASVPTAGLAVYLAPAVSLEGIDATSTSIDALSISLDSRVWAQGQARLAAFTADGSIATFSGETMAARLETKDFHPNPLGRSYISSVFPLLPGAEAKASIGYRDRMSAPLVYTPLREQGPGGFVPFETSARYFRVRVEIDAGAPWEEVTGLYVQAVPDGVY